MSSARIQHGALHPGYGSGIHVSHRWAGLRAERLGGTYSDVGGIFYETDTFQFYILSDAGWSRLGQLEASIGTARTTLGGHRLLARGVDGLLGYASCDDVFSARCLIGLSTGAVSSGATLVCPSEGVIAEPSWNWAPQQPLFLGLNGMLVQSLPLVALVCLPVGIALSENTVMLRLGQLILL